LGSVKETYHISDNVAYSEVRSLILEDKEPFELKPEKLETKQYEFTFAEQYKSFLKELQYQDDVIFGKDKTLEVVAVELDGSNAFLFKLDGSLSWTQILKDFKGIYIINTFVISHPTNNFVNICKCIWV